MNEVLAITLIGLAAGVLGTGSGTLIAFFIRQPGKVVLSFVLGSAGGIMLAIVLMDLLPESIEAGNFVSAFAGLLAGVLFILLLDLKMPHFHFFETSEEMARFIRTGTILGLGIAMHNIPEGMAMACPLCAGGMNFRWVLLYTALAGLPMGIGAFLGAVLGSISPLFLSLSLGFAAGAMLYIIFGELIPGAHSAGNGHAGTFGAVFGTVAGILLLAII